MQARLLLPLVATVWTGAVAACSSSRFTVGGLQDGGVDVTERDADATGVPDAEAVADATDDASPFELSTLPFVELWLRADDVPPGPVTTWSDRSLRKHDATLVSALTPNCTPPTLVDGPVGSGRKAVAFDGAFNCLHLPSGFVDFRNGLSLFVVARTHAQPGTTTRGFLRLSSTSGSNAGAIVFGRDDATVLRYATFSAAGTTPASASVDGGVVDETWHLYEVAQDAGTPETAAPAVIRRDGNIVATSTDVLRPATILRDSNIVGRGASTNLSGDIAEILLISKKVDDLERAAIEARLHAKWNL
jgi:hypothetical protein